MKFWHALVAPCALALSGCSSTTVKDTLGLYRSAPDEYRVVSRPPLSVPPQFGLRPPAPTESSPNQLPASEQAESLVLGNANGSVKADTAVKSVTAAPAAKAKKDTQVSSADSKFMKKIGAEQADPNVRQELVEEQYQKIEKQETGSWMDKLDWTSDKKDPTVDAGAEAERIQKNEDAGKPVTEGDTPQVKGRDTGLLGKILGY
ncbi:MAG: DUF3035 domain-containing protein [Proteobacteria bacterium]|nr:DUF3035 domain-containing protein [Pseudomonadota bacterium]